MGTTTYLMWKEKKLDQTWLVARHVWVDDVVAVDGTEVDDCITVKRMKAENKDDGK